MKFRLIAPAGVLLLGIGACSTSNDNNTGTGGASNTGTGGNSATGGATGDGGSTSSGGAAGGTGGSTSGTGGAAGGTDDASAGGSGGGPDASGTGTGGSVGTGGTAGNDGAAAAPLTITATDVGNFNNAFLVTSCTAAGTGFDCPNTAAGQVGCPQTAWVPPDGIPASEVTGTTYSEVFNVAGGEPNRIYAVTVRVRGQVEPRIYTGGQTLVVGAGAGQADPNGTNNLLQIGGRPGTTRVDYNVFMMTIAPAAGATPIPGRDGGAEPTFYAFNAVDAAHEGNHFNFQVDETFTFRVRPGYRVTLTNHDSNCIAIKNCGNGGPYNFANSGLCEAQGRSIAGVTLPATFRGNALPNGGSQPFQTQFLNFQVTNIVAE